MPRFFVDPSDVRDGRVILTGNNAHHAAYALRLAVGDVVTVCDQVKSYACRLTRFDGETVEAEVLTEKPCDTEPPYHAVLFQALPKGDKLEIIIQKAVESGVSEIVPFESSRCVMKSKPDAEDRKTERRAKIAEEAAKQSGRGIIPPVRKTVTDFKKIIEEAAECDLALFCYEGTGTKALDVVLSQSFTHMKDSIPRIAIVIGSEGGFSPEEAQAAADAGLCMTGLGPRILRTETASGFVLACLAFHFGL